MDTSRGAIEASYCRRIYGNRLSAEQASGFQQNFDDIRGMRDSLRDLRGIRRSKDYVLIIQQIKVSKTSMGAAKNISHPCNICFSLLDSKYIDA
ncbi:hypothetical protein M5K25_013254 [Dendrobium thyrsiflorum]|uniref:Uncharacterized protein n=1 Tax=Dendrobium thyrsiflorum TaxID=117978 RepID=A0ABD0USE8_DENTH